MGGEGSETGKRAYNTADLRRQDGDSVLDHQRHEGMHVDTVAAIGKGSRILCALVLYAAAKTGGGTESGRSPWREVAVSITG